MSEYTADVCLQWSFNLTASEQPEASFGASLNVYQSHVFPITTKSSSKQMELDLTF